MKLRIAGKDVSDTLGREIAESARHLRNADLSRLIDGETDVLNVRKATNEADHIERHVKALLGRYWVDSALFETPQRNGAMGWMRHFIKRALWKMFRYQHDWCLYRQNIVNAQMSYGLEFERQVREKQIADIERRIQKLEKALTDTTSGARRDALETGKQ